MQATTLCKLLHKLKRNLTLLVLSGKLGLLLLFLLLLAQGRVIVTLPLEHSLDKDVDNTLHYPVILSKIETPKKEGGGGHREESSKQK